jgi:hypothetical protein
MIDLNIVSPYTVFEIERLISKEIKADFIDTTVNMATVVLEGILIEIVATKAVAENAWFYANSGITDVLSTVIKGDSGSVAELTKIVKDFQIDMSKEKLETVKRLMYFVMSLERITAKGDDYKFFFHNNIIIHEVVRLLYFAKGNTEKNYLPPAGVRILRRRFNCKTDIRFHER